MYMTYSDNPRVRSLELVPIENNNEEMYALRDPYGFSDTVALPLGTAMLVTLMNGERTLGEMRIEFEQQFGKSINIEDIEGVVRQLDERFMLDNQRFADYQEKLLEEYKALEVRPAAHAGGAYAGEPEALRQQLGNLFTDKEGPGVLPSEGNTQGEPLSNLGNHLCAIMSPHIDLHRGGVAFAWAYDRLVTESDADVYVILGTAHTPLASFFSVSRKHFDTPLGTVRTDQTFIDSLESRMQNGNGATEAKHVFDDELPHRGEHSIEFQTLMLQYAMGEKRDYKIVPILVGSFHPFVQHNRSPGDSPAVADFITALRQTAENYHKKVCFIAGVDMAHIGQQFGDQELLDDSRLTEQWTDDQELLSRACEGDAEAWFIHVAAQEDRNRICGLAPTYVMLEAARPNRGELLKYDQAVAEERTSCVSFASVAFYS